MAAGFVGVVIGVVIALVAIQAAFLDTALLRRLDLIGREPVHYFAPALFSAALGIVAALLLLTSSIVAAMKPPAAVLIGAYTVTGLFVVWTLVSVLPTLRMIVAFVAVKRAAAQIDDTQVSRLKTDERGKDHRAGDA